MTVKALVLLPVSLPMEQATARHVVKLKDIRKEILWHFMVLNWSESFGTMFLDYQSLMAGILASIFGLLLLVMVKDLRIPSIVLVAILQ